MNFKTKKESLIDELNKNMQQIKFIQQLQKRQIEIIGQIKLIEEIENIDKKETEKKTK